MDATLTPAKFIRAYVFDIKSQKEFGRLLGYTQVHVSRFEGGLPFSRKAQERIRELARARGISWNNDWFFEVPKNVLPGSPSPRGHKEKKPKRLNVRLVVDAELLDLARDAGTDLSAVLEEALRSDLRERKLQEWREENRGAIEEYNQFIAENGLLSDEWRSF